MRPKVNKTICCCPKTYTFTPNGITDAKIVNLSCEEVEALDLKNNKGLDQVAAANSMGISQSTFQRILALACKKMSDAIVNGKIINIQKNTHQ